MEFEWEVYRVTEPDYPPFIGPDASRHVSYRVIGPGSTSFLVYGSGTFNRGVRTHSLYLATGSPCCSRFGGQLALDSKDGLSDPAPYRPYLGCDNCGREFDLDMGLSVTHIISFFYSRGEEPQQASLQRSAEGKVAQQGSVYEWTCTRFNLFGLNANPLQSEVWASSLADCLSGLAQACLPYLQGESDHIPLGD